MPNQVQKMEENTYLKPHDQMQRPSKRQTRTKADFRILVCNDTDQIILGLSIAVNEKYTKPNPKLLGDKNNLEVRVGYPLLLIQGTLSSTDSVSHLHFQFIFRRMICISSYPCIQQRLFLMWTVCISAALKRQFPLRKKMRGLTFLN